MAVGKQYEYDAVIHELPEKGGAYVVFPWNIREEFGKGRVKVHATFDGIPYDGSIVNMGVENEDGSICYILGMLKSIRTQLGKGDGDTVVRKTPKPRNSTYVVSHHWWTLKA